MCCCWMHRAAVQIQPESELRRARRVARHGADTAKAAFKRCVVMDLGVERDMKDLWAWCSPCARWFFVPLRPDGARPSPTEHRIECPVCTTIAGRFQSDEPTAVR